MGQKKIVGDFDVVGNITQNGSPIGGGGINAEQLFLPFSNESTYNVGDTVSYDNKFYICKTAISTAAEWNASKWVETSPVMQVLDLKNASNDSTGTFTVEKFALISSPLCIIKAKIRSTGFNTDYNESYFLKKDHISTTGDYLYYASSKVSSNAVSGMKIYYFGVEISRNTRNWRIFCFDDATLFPNKGNTTTYELTQLQLAGRDYDIGKSVMYDSTEPVADNTSGRLKFVILDHEPATYYNGYYYIITESAQAQSNDGGTGGGSN